MTQLLFECNFESKFALSFGHGNNSHSLQIAKIWSLYLPPTFILDAEKGKIIF